MRRFLSRLARIEAEQIGEKARQARVEEVVREMLAQVVVGWEGVTDEGGWPVQWRPELLDELDAAAVAELVRRIAEPAEELGIKKEVNG